MTDPAIIALIIAIIALIQSIITSIKQHQPLQPDQTNDIQDWIAQLEHDLNQINATEDEDEDPFFP